MAAQMIGKHARVGCERNSHNGQVEFNLVESFEYWIKCLMVFDPTITSNPPLIKKRPISPRY